MPAVREEGYRGESRIRWKYFQCVVGMVDRTVIKGVCFEDTRHVVVQFVECGRIEPGVARDLNPI